jgi:hypothetical protein
VKLASALPALLFSLFLQFTFADQVVMKNGDRLSGTIEKYDDKNLLLKNGLRRRAQARLVRRSADHLY